jgi:hypothetical protein
LFKLPPTTELKPDRTAALFKLLMHIYNTDIYYPMKNAASGGGYAQNQTEPEMLQLRRLHRTIPVIH